MARGRRPVRHVRRTARGGPLQRRPGLQSRGGFVVRRAHRPNPERGAGLAARRVHVGVGGRGGLRRAADHLPARRGRRLSQPDADLALRGRPRCAGAGDGGNPADLRRLGGTDARLVAVRPRSIRDSDAVRRHHRRGHRDAPSERHGLRARLHRAARPARVPGAGATLRQQQLLGDTRGKLRARSEPVRLPRPEPSHDTPVRARR